MATIEEHLKTLLSSMKGPHIVGSTFSEKTFPELHNFSKAVLRGIDKEESRGNGFISLARTIEPIHAVMLSARTECMEVWSKKISQTLLASVTEPGKRNLARDVRDNFLTATSSLQDRFKEAWNNNKHRPEVQSFVLEAMIRNLGIVAKVQPEDKAEYLDRIIDTIYPNMSPETKKSGDQAIKSAFIQQAFGKFSEKPFREDGFLLLKTMEKLEAKRPGISEIIDNAIVEASNLRNPEAKTSNDFKVTHLSDNVIIKNWKAEGGTIGRNPFEGPAIIREENSKVVSNSFFWKGENLGNYKGQLPISDKVMSSIIENMQESYPEDFKRCLDSFTTNITDNNIDLGTLQPSLRELVENNLSSSRKLD